MRGRACCIGLMIASACATGAEEPNTGGPVLGDASATSNSSETSGSTDSVASSGTIGGSASGQLDGTASGPVTSGSEGEPGTSESSGQIPPVCPPDPADEPCVVCSKAECCEQYLACLATPLCSCALACFLAGGSSGDCLMECGASAEALALFNCAAASCEGAC